VDGAELEGAEWTTDVVQQKQLVVGSTEDGGIWLLFQSVDGRSCCNALLVTERWLLVGLINGRLRDDEHGDG
jgi:hypothetical protein